MNVFDNSNKILIVFKKIKPSIIIFAVILLCFYIAIQSFESSASDREYESLNRAINRSIVQCYAVEGTYPPSLDYIIDTYGLNYNRTRFFIDYRPIGSNLMPDYTIIRTN